MIPTIPASESQGRWMRSSNRSNIVIVALLAVATLLLIVAVVAAFAIRGHTKDLSEAVKKQDVLVEANVRTLSQAQRELLRLQMLLDDRFVPEQDTQLQLALVGQRMQESSLSYQEHTLGAEALLQRARTLAYRWRITLRPTIDDYLANPTRPASQLAVIKGELQDLEHGYNDLMAKGEQNRKQVSNDATENTAAVIRASNQLVWLVMATFIGSSIVAAIGLVMLRRLSDERNRRTADLATMNDELTRYQQIIEATSAMVMLTDQAGRVVWVNEAFTHNLGFSNAELSGRDPDGLLFGTRTSTRVRERLASEARMGRSAAGELACYKANGDVLWLHTSISPLMSEGQNNYVTVFTDITERHAAEELLKAARIDAENAAQEKSAFLSTMSHEIRTPLNAVLGMTEILLLSDLRPSQAEQLRTAQRSGQHLLSLLNDILDLSALDSGSSRSEQIPFDLAVVIDDVIAMNKPRATTKGVSLASVIESGTPLAVVGDELHLRQILVNLVGNAVKFTEHGSVDLEVGLDVGIETGIKAGIDNAGDSNGDSVTKTFRFQVIDTGIGVPEHRVDQLFRPFIQGDTSTTRRYGGSGLGLAISKRLAESMGGSLDLASAEGIGTTVTLTLPLTVSADTPARTNADLETDVPALRVLVAEDDVVNQTVIMLMLERLGLDAEMVDDGGRAVATSAEQHFDVILMDMQMPTMDGIEAQQAIRARDGDRAPYICAVTAEALSGDRDRMIAAGMDDYLAKPISVEGLRSVLLRAAQRVL